jgi:hypothetical protein
MFARLRRGQVLKSKACKNGKISYILILQNKPFFIELYKTVKLSKNWEDDSSPLEVRVKKYDFTNYTNRIVNEKSKLVDNEEEIIRLKENIENLPEETKKKIYGRDNLEIIANIKLFPNNHYDPSYGSEIQKISNINSGLESLSENLSEKLYKKAFSIIQILPL